MDAQHPFDEFVKKHDLKLAIPSRVSDGWLPLLEDLVSKLKQRGWTGEVAQIKEKFGGLRFYANPSIKTGNTKEEIEEFQRLIYEAEDKSFKICEFCGQPGKRTSALGWIKVLCPKDLAIEIRELANRRRLNPPKKASAPSPEPPTPPLKPAG